MYKLELQYENYEGKLKMGTAYFNLDGREIMGNLVEILSVFRWTRENRDATEVRDLSTQETQDFYNDLESLLLRGWGELSDDKENFRKSGKYDFEESAFFSAIMEHFLFNPLEGVKLLEGMLPTAFMKRLETMTPEDLQANVLNRADGVEKDLRIRQLEAELASKSSATVTPVTQ